MKKIIVLCLVFFELAMSHAQDLTDHNRSDTRLLAGYTSHMLTKGQGQVQTLDLLIHTFDYGITNYLTLGIGGTYIPSWHRQLFIFKSKIGKRINKRLSMAVANYWIIVIPGSEDIDFISPLYGLATVDFDRVSITAGTGILFSQDDAQIIGNLGVDFTLGEHFSLINENWWGYDPTNNFYDESAFIVGLGGRYRIKTWTFELGGVGGFVIGKDGNGGAIIPHLSISFHF